MLKGLHGCIHFERLSILSTQVTADDVIYTEKIRNVAVMDKLRLGRVLLLGSRSETTIGRPFITGASVVAAVEVCVYTRNNRNV